MTRKGSPPRYRLCVDFLSRMAHHLAYKPDTNQFAIAAYIKARDALISWGTLDGYETIPGIGKGIRAKLDEIIETGKCAQLAEAEAYGPPYSVHELTKIPGIGPKGAYKLWSERNIGSLADLQSGIESGNITDPKLVKGFYDMQANSERISREVVRQAMEPVLEIIKSTRGIQRVIMPGSFRRRRADVRDIDVLIEVDAYDKVPQLVKTLSSKLGYEISASAKNGDRKAYMEMPILDQVRKLDLNFIETPSWGTAVLHFTGPAAYNEAVRGHIKRMHPEMSLSQYGLKVGRKLQHFEDERDVFEAIDLPYIAPHLRDYVMAVHHDITTPVETRKLTLAGDTHSHTTASDGEATIEELADAAAKAGLEFIGVTDHSPLLNGPNDAEVRATARTIRNTRYAVKVYASAEIDIKADGSLDYLEATIPHLHYVVLALHRNPDTKTLERLERAFKTVAEFKMPTILAHPTARLIGKRSEIEVDYGELFKLCKLYNIVLEINSQPERCDLPDTHILQAARYGLKYAIGSDTHWTDGPELLKNGLDIALRANLKPSQVINSSHARFKAFLNID